MKSAIRNVPHIYMSLHVYPYRKNEVGIRGRLNRYQLLVRVQKLSTPSPLIRIVVFFLARWHLLIWRRRISNFYRQPQWRLSISGVFFLFLSHQAHTYTPQHVYVCVGFTFHIFLPLAPFVVKSWLTQTQLCTCVCAKGYARGVLRCNMGVGGSHTRDVKL